MLGFFLVSSETTTCFHLLDLNTKVDAHMDSWWIWTQQHGSHVCNLHHAFPLVLIYFGGYEL